jgi:hypothetical protein
MSTGLADKLYLYLRSSLLKLRVVRSEGLTVLTVVMLKVLGKWFMTWRDCSAFVVRVIQYSMCVLWV